MRKTVGFEWMIGYTGDLGARDGPGWRSYGKYRMHNGRLEGRQWAGQWLYEKGAI